MLGYEFHLMEILSKSERGNCALKPLLHLKPNRLEKLKDTS